MACSAAVAVKVTGPSPATVAVTVFVSDSLPSVSLVAAWPLASVVAVVDDVRDKKERLLDKGGGDS